MKKAFLFLLLVLHLPAWGSQIAVGLRSDNLVSWSVWERRGTALEHYLLLFNKGPQKVDVKIKLKKFASVGTNFRDVPTNQTLFHLTLASQQLVRLKYPRKLRAADYAEYFENEQRIGLLPASTARPGNALLSDQYHFYTDQGINSGPQGYWVALAAIDAPPARFLLAAAAPFHPASETLKEEHHLAKLYANFKGGYPRSGALDSLVTAGVGASVVRLDVAHPSAVLPVSAGVVSPGFSTFAVYVERVEDAYYYDEAKRLVPQKGATGGAVFFIPVFPAKPE